ncbi:MFS transporter [Microbacterium excoecariae]|uniref:MFS transporter n=1 Tax=Microbacterium excoecariae TaxID=2715210 RepID=UPI00140802BA|nr:MFS transporter [Microbacterium excoecariae]NHI16525.1 MFS transporter [Microbacterium excoecariae]
MQFAIVAVSFILVFAAAGSPIPLYETYRAEDGVTTGDLAVDAVAYFAGTLFSLLLLGRLSDHVGRKPVTIAALLIASAGVALMTQVDGSGVLGVARLLQGVASGLAASAIGAYVVDVAPERPAWLPTMITGSGPMFGIPAGALISGTLVQIAPLPRLVPFAAISALLLAAAVASASVRETVAPAPGALRSLLPRVSAPRGTGRLLFAIGAAAFATWSMGGAYQAFAPTITAEYLGSDNALVAASVFSSIMIAGPLGGPIAGRLGPRRAVRIGIVVFALAIATALASLLLGSIISFLLASLIAAVAQGTTASAGTGAMLRHARPSERGATLAAVYVISYSGAAFPALVAGQFTGTGTLAQIFTGYTALVAVGMLVVLAPFPRAADTPRA